jgi:PAS domain S-box-containing protein
MTDQTVISPLSQQISPIIDGINTGIYGVDESGYCTFINREALRLLGYSKDDCIGQDMHVLIHQKQNNGDLYPRELCAICSHQKNTQASQGNNEIFRNSFGDSFFVSYSSEAIIDDGIFKGYVISFSDITDQKVKELEFAALEQQYKYLFDNNPAPMFIWDFETLEILDCNEEAAIKYGYTREEFLKLTLRDVRPQEDIDMINAATLNEESYGRIHKKVWRHFKKNGEIIFAEVTGHLIEFNHKRASLVIVNDVTDRYKTENELRESEEKLRTATSIARLGYWRVNVDSSGRYWSDELYKIWGVSKEKFKVNYQSFLNIIHPEDLPKFEAEQQISFAHKSDTDFEYRIILPNGSFKWLREIGKAVKGPDGNPMAFHGTVQDITAQKLMSLSLEEAKQRYDFVSKATSDVIWDWDLEKETLFWGAGYEAVFGYNLAGISGKINSWTDYLHPEDKETIINGIYSVIKSAETNWKAEYRFLKVDGTYAYVVDRGFVIRDEKGRAIRMVGAMHDITLRKQEEHRLKLLESVVTHTNDAVLITEAEPFDQPGPRIVYVNDAFTRMTGYSAEEVLGKTPRILQGPKSDKAELKRLSNAIRNWEPCEITTINYKKNGEEFWIKFSVNPVADEKGWYTHWVAVERDVTEAKKAEEELKLFADELFNRNKELHQFGYVISHNLRSPVANIMGIADLLEMDKHDPETVEICTSSLKSAVNSLDTVIKDLSKILSLTDGSVKLIKESIEFDELIGNIIQDISSIIDYTGARINVSTGSLVLYSHKAYLYSIFYNLLTNAIKYKSESTPDISISATASDERAVIKIADNGIGINLKKHGEDIFKPYKRFETSVEGKGLGLFLVKSHVEALNGTLLIESEFGVGTTFTIILPMK